ncbi:hypothetical protein Pmani_014212 [Petrolisthes manimaculis]|uniref:DDE Tnp4 domain-containing protein n=1 Tax=Petrolisthes manimaculis TaxID=1843537 RepID=A0AAE1PP33_9EUCA|nr:hypothetical protein Pmani_017651 [Petrolisthes manimaculis]KAK4314507.1 hypothetical protein Pmani_014212 [Petrolisthes manimaculis]
MDDDIIGAYAMLLLLKKKRNLQKKRKRLWSRQWLQRRREESVAFRLLRELEVEDPATLRQWMRLDRQQYLDLLRLVTPLIEKQDTNMRQAVTAEERLTLTLRYLATGESYRSLSCQFRISHNLISSIIPTVCKAIYKVLQSSFVHLPTTTEEWQKVAGRGESTETRIFNYRLSRARRTTENAFGILTARFQVFKQPIRTTPENVQDITLAAVALHNYLTEKSKDTYIPQGFTDREDIENGRLHQGQMHQHAHAAIEDLHPVGRGHTNEAKQVRELLKGYFNNEGQVHWQAQMAQLH